MNGVVLALPKVFYDFGNGTASVERTQVVVRSFCTEPVRELVLLVRVHTIKVDAGTLAVELVPVAPTREDPAPDFAAEDVIASVAVEDAEVGDLLREVCISPVPGYVQVRVVGMKTAGSLNATLSIELLGRQ